MSPRLTLPPGQPTESLSPAPLTPEQRRHVEAGLRMVERCAAEIAGRYPDLVDRRDLVSMGALALDEAARTYQKEKHPSFLHFAGHHVRGRMLDNRWPPCRPRSRGCSTSSTGRT